MVKRITRKGDYKHPLYSTWIGMMNRCHNPNFNDFRLWGGRGIKVSDEWHDFQVFVDDMGGGKPSITHQIDRIDNDSNYAKGNCRWVTPSENVKNRRPSSEWSNSPRNKNKVTGVRLPPEMREVLEVMAKSEHRNLSGMIVHILKREVNRNAQS